MCSCTNLHANVYSRFICNQKLKKQPTVLLASSKLEYTHTAHQPALLRTGHHPTGQVHVVKPMHVFLTAQTGNATPAWQRLKTDKIEQC